MYKINWKNERFIILFILSLIVSAFILYDYLPQKIPMHWNIYGKIDKYVNKTYFNLLLLPISITGIYLLMLFTPFLDRRYNWDNKFIKIYTIIRISIIFFLSLLYLIIMLYSVGYKIPVQKIVPILVGILFFVIGKCMLYIRQNSFIGIRLPWTLKNPDVWNKTHKLSGDLFKFSGIIIILSSIFLSPLYIFIILILLILLIFIITFIKSRNTNI